MHAASCRESGWPVRRFCDQTRPVDLHEPPPARLTSPSAGPPTHAVPSPVPSECHPASLVRPVIDEMLEELIVIEHAADEPPPPSTGARSTATPPSTAGCHPDRCWNDSISPCRIGRRPTRRRTPRDLPRQLTRSDPQPPATRMPIWICHRKAQSGHTQAVGSH